MATALHEVHRQYVAPPARTRRTTARTTANAAAREDTDE
jgi:hypothetical protein